ncbi:MAG: TPM domain-containing protein [Bacteroidia bacterium]|nr:TPM domain-containing protein [Bacteroidia bacterium]
MQLKSTKLFSFLLVLQLIFVLPVLADVIPERPSPPRLVNDYTGILTASENNTLEHKLVAFNDSTSTQIAVVLVKSLDGYDISDYAFKLGEKWGIGQKKKNNGVLILIAPNEKKVFIATGYGVEEYLTDALSRNIVEQRFKPAFRENKYYEGIDAGTTDIMDILTGKFKADKEEGVSGGGGSIILLIVIIVFIIVLIKAFGKGGGNNGGRTFNSTGPIIWGGRPSSFGGGFGGSRSSGGSFGGFGGGSFGGGGAGGSW